MRTSTAGKPHSDAVRRVVAVETATLQKRCLRVVTKWPDTKVMVHMSEAIRGSAPQMTSPADSAAMTNILDRLISLEFAERIVEDRIIAAKSEADGIVLAIELDEMIGYHRALIEEMASSLHQEPSDELSDLLLEMAALYGISALRASMTKKPTEKEALEELSKHMLSEDPAYKYLLSKKTIPYRIYKWLIESKIPGTESVVAICKDYGTRWRAIQSRMDSARENGIVDDFTWNELWKLNDKIIEDWKAAITILTARVR